MSSNFILKWGIVSSGLISADFCTALLSLKSDHHVIHAVAARNIEDAKKFAERFGIPNYYDSYDKLNEDLDVNVVYVGAINSAHKEISVKALNAKKHVLCEKPMTLV
jgi:dihydrodiol dehydrogenase / D-xylose 1-dehydrogenase (NADP)